MEKLLWIVTTRRARKLQDMPGVPGFVRLRLAFTKSDVGTFVVHCHIGEHVDNGMMQTVTVVE